ncbi:MAG: hypothetical protein KDD52_00740 [Bdellovibrionales bacterium]|nr:hypothetical protein [Bdellovibrionales bacterium]
MTLWTQKVLNGLNPTSKDWKEHLKKAHLKAPSMTPNAYAKYKTKEGFCSYEVLANTLLDLNTKKSILDLACGDGFLIPYIQKKKDYLLLLSDALQKNPAFAIHINVL